MRFFYCNLEFYWVGVEKIICDTSEYNDFIHCISSTEWFYSLGIYFLMNIVILFPNDLYQQWIQSTGNVFFIEKI